MDGPLLAIDRDDARPLGVQLVEGIRRGILSGALRPGDPMPSTRAFAADLGVARSSVVTAYEQLAGEGYLETRQGAPTRVAELEAHAARRLTNVSTAGVRDTAPRASRDPAARIDLSPGRPSTFRLDERAWRAAWRAAAATSVPQDAPPPFGLLDLRTAIADHLRQARGLGCTADDIVVTAGTAEALSLLALSLAALLGRAPRIAIEDPGYPGARRTIERHGATTVPVPVGTDGLDLAALDRIARSGGVAPARGRGRRHGPGLDAIMVTPSHQYPLGGRLPAADRLALLEAARTHGALVIEDDYDSEFRHTGAPLPALASLDRDERTVLVGSFSKVLTPWVRVGYLVLPRRPELRAAVADVRTDAPSPVAGPVQQAVAHLLGTGALRRHISAVRREYAHRRRLVLDALGGTARSDVSGETDAPRGIRLLGLDGGLHAVLELPDAATADSLVAALARAGVVVAPLSDYAVPMADAPAARPRAGIVLGYAGVSDTALVEALARIRALLGA